jgi:hypothetical protein
VKGEKLLTLSGKGFSTQWDPLGNLRSIVAGKRAFEPPMKYTLFEINGEAADVEPVGDDGEALSMKLTTKAASGTLTVSPGKEIRLRYEADEGDARDDVSLILSFPLEAEFHIPEKYNLGRKIDRDMPVGEWHSSGSYPISRYTYMEQYKELYSKGLSFNFFLADVAGLWLRFMTRESHSKPDVHISRHSEAFAVSFTWSCSDEAFLEVFSSMEEAVGNFQDWLEKSTGVRKLREVTSVPAWVHDVKLVFIVDMMRGNWEITHDFQDVINLAGDLKKIGCPEATLFYLPGWNGAYDSTYPIYEPHPELGGREKFREMMESLHRNGYRVMIHTNAWGLDPCHPDIDELIRYVRKDEEGSYRGWQCSIPSLKIKRRVLKFRSNSIALEAPEGADNFTVEMTRVPEECEAFIEVGAFRVGGARVRFTVDRRSAVSPPGWFEEKNSYLIPFPFLLKPGRNELRVEVMGGTKGDWGESWYRVRHCFIPPTPYTSWSYPILSADTTNPEWIEVFVGNVASAVREYGIDTVHVDATGYEKHTEILDKLKERLPDVPIAGEGFSGLEALGYWTFCQGARQSLTGYLEVMQGTRQQSSLPDRGKLEKLYGWLDKPSRVADFVGDYVRIYPHLCAADAFVPVGKVCNTFPPRPSPRNNKDLWQVFRDARRLGYIPGLRVNHRKHGLDEETAKAVKELATW